MFNKTKETPQPETAIAIQTVISEGITLKDNVICGAGNVSIGGVFFGEIDIEGFLIIAESGSVRGMVRASSIHVHGILEGNAVAHNAVRIFDGGKILGDVSCGSFVVDEGAAFGGQCNMEESRQYAAGNGERGGFGNPPLHLPDDYGLPQFSLKDSD